MYWWFIIAALIVLFGVPTLLKIFGTMLLLGIGFTGIIILILVFFLLN